MAPLACTKPCPPDRIDFHDLEALVRRHGFLLAARHGGRFDYLALP